MSDEFYVLSGIFTTWWVITPTAYVKSAAENKIKQEQIMELLDKHNFLQKLQPGFRKNHFTNFCLSYLTDKISKVLILVFLPE